jgi:hypothetical protein
MISANLSHRVECALTSIVDTDSIACEMAPDITTVEIFVAFILAVGYVPYNLPVWEVGLDEYELFLALNGGDNFKAMQQSQATARTIATQNQSAEMKARLASASADRQGETAKKRYEAGCQMTFASNDLGKFAAIQEGKPVLDAATGAPIANGAVVCDQIGMTAIIANGVADSVAFSPDRQVIRDAMQRYQDARYQAPGQ